MGIFDSMSNWFKGAGKSIAKTTVDIGEGTADTIVGAGEGIADTAPVVGKAIGEGALDVLGAVDILEHPNKLAKAIIIMKTQHTTGSDILKMIHDAGENAIENPAVLFWDSVGLLAFCVFPEAEEVQALTELGSEEIIAFKPMEEIAGREIVISKPIDGINFYPVKECSPQDLTHFYPIYKVDAIELKSTLIDRAWLVVQPDGTMLVKETWTFPDGFEEQVTYKIDHIPIGTDDNIFHDPNLKNQVKT